MPKRAAIASLLVPLAGASCTGSRSDAPVTVETELARIADHCGLPRASLRLAAGGELHIQPPVDARYAAVDCALRALRESGVVRNMPMGFIGNEAYPPQANGVQGQAPPGSALVAVEFSGSAQSLDRLAHLAAGLGWRVESRAGGSLRINPPPGYEPSRFGALLARIEESGLTDVGIRLIGPNGPVGPED